MRRRWAPRKLPIAFLAVAVGGRSRGGPAGGTPLSPACDCVVAFLSMMALLGRFRELWKRCPLFCCKNRDPEEVSEAPPNSAEPQEASVSVDSPRGTYTAEKLPSSGGSVGAEDPPRGRSDLKEEEGLTHLSEGREHISLPVKEAEVMETNLERRQRRSGLVSRDEDALFSQDPEGDSLDGVSSPEDEDAVPSWSSPLDSEEEEEAARWPSCDPEKCEDLLHRLCQRLCGPPSREATRAVDYVARKRLGLAIEHFLESSARECAELIRAVFDSPYCRLDAALDLLVAQVKGGPQRPSSPLDAATAKATRAIGGMIGRIRDIERLEQVWLPDLFPALVNLLIEATRLEEEEGTSGNPENNSLSSGEILKILRNLLERMAQRSQENILTMYRWLLLHEVPEVRRSALAGYGHLTQHLEHLWTEDDTIRDLFIVLTLVEDEDVGVAEAAKATLWELAESLQWRLERSLLAGDTFFLQELLHKVAKRLIQHCSSREELDEIARGCQIFFDCSLPWVRKMAAMLFGHLVHKAGGSLSERRLLICGTELSRLIVDEDPGVGRVAAQTKDIVLKALALHHQPGLMAACRRTLTLWTKKRYPPEYF